MIEFIEQVYIPDLLAIASFYKDWLARRRPLGQPAVLATATPETPTTTAAPTCRPAA